jgi:hypothetical protein
VLLVFKVFAKLVEYGALFGCLRVTEEDEMNEHAVDYCCVLCNAGFDLLYELILLFVLADGIKDVLHPSVNQTLEGTLELLVRLRVFELKQIEISLSLIEVKCVDSIVVAAKSHLLHCLFPWYVELKLEV